MGGNFLTALSPDNDSDVPSQFSDVADKNVNPSEPVYLEKGNVLTGDRVPESNNAIPPTAEELRAIGECAAEIKELTKIFVTDIRSQGKAA